MVEVVDGLLMSLDQINNGTLTFKGKPLQFQCIDQKNQVYQAGTNLTDEEISAGNNDIVFTFSLANAQGVVKQTIVPISEKEREEITQNVRQTKDFKPKQLNRAQKSGVLLTSPQQQSQDFSGGDTVKTTSSSSSSSHQQANKK